MTRWLKTLLTEEPNRNNHDGRSGFWAMAHHDSHPRLFLSMCRGLEAAGVFARTERGQLPAALIPLRAAHCPSDPAAAQISWLKRHDKMGKFSYLEITQNANMKKWFLLRWIWSWPSKFNIENICKLWDANMRALLCWKHNMLKTFCIASSSSKTKYERWRFGIIIQLPKLGIYTLILLPTTLYGPYWHQMCCLCIVSVFCMYWFTYRRQIRLVTLPVYIFVLMWYICMQNMQYCVHGYIYVS